MLIQILDLSDLNFHNVGIITIITTKRLNAAGSTPMKNVPFSKQVVDMICGDEFSKN